MKSEKSQYNDFNREASMKKLTDPFELRNLSLKNRLVMPPMATGRSDDGKVSEELKSWYDEKTKNGKIGLVIVEHEYTLPEGKAGENQLSVSDDEDIEGLSELADIIHRNGSKAFLQINHAGGKACIESPKAPSATEYKTRSSERIAKMMDEDDIRNVTEGFVKAALRAKKAGFDGVEIHAAHGYLLSQFYSPLTNHRTDAYTGSTLEGRTRLHCEIIRKVKEAVGQDYPVAIRFGAADDMEGGAEGKDAPYAAKLFEEAGCDLIDVSGGLSGYIRPEIKDAGYFRQEADAIAQSVRIPVLTAGGITSRKEADELLAQYHFDLIGVARAIFRDSDWAEKNMD